MSRTATCKTCGIEFITPSDTGRLPLRCPTCSPNFVSRYRVEILELRDRIAHLERALGDRPRPVRDADRQALTAAIRRVAAAQGPGPTAEALLHLRDVAQSWAYALDGRRVPTITNAVQPPEAA